jgi:hypothetical protein
MKKTTILHLVLIMLTILALMSIAADDSGRTFTTTLLGANEVPGPGDPDGSGTATITLNLGQGRVCWDLAVSGVSTPVAAHIHVAPVGVAGPVVVPLSPPIGGTSSGCAEGVNRDLIKAIIQNPEQYYVNVHTTEYPAGALRGQLSK